MGDDETKTTIIKKNRRNGDKFFIKARNIILFILALGALVTGAGALYFATEGDLEIVDKRVDKIEVDIAVIKRDISYNRTGIKEIKGDVKEILIEVMK